MQRPTELGRNLVLQSEIRRIAKVAERLRDCLQYPVLHRCPLQSAIILRFESGPWLSERGECGGHSGGETPEPIPNSEDKSASVLYCTEVREPSGTMGRCHAHLISILQTQINNW